MGFTSQLGFENLIFKEPYKAFCLRNDEHNSKGFSKLLNIEYVIIWGMGMKELDTILLVTKLLRVYNW